MPKKMSDLDLKGILQAAKNDALSANTANKLSADREKAMRYYLGDVSQDISTEAGRSSVVSTDLSDTIEGLMPILMEIFCGGDEVVKFEPVGPEDTKAAEQETDYVNHVFMQQNQGFLILYSMIKDALLSKAGIAKIAWETEEKQERESYYDLDDIGFAVLAGNEDVEIIEHTVKPMPGEAPDEEEDDEEQPPEDPNAPQQPKWHDVTIKVKRNTEQAKIYPVPPEEFGIAASARNIQNCGYCYHQTPRRENELIEEGYDREQVRRLPTHRPYTTSEETSRDTVDESIFTQTGPATPGQRHVLITEHYIQMDYDGSGDIAVYRVTTGEHFEPLRKPGEDSVVRLDYFPFAAMTPVIMTHRFWGRSVADLIMDIQQIKTVLVRGLLDNLYMRNNFRTEVPESHCGVNTIDDLLEARPGGIVRTKQAGGLNPLMVEDVSAAVYPALQYFDTTREWRTGVSRQGQGIDPDSLQNQVATIAHQMELASDKRVKLIARIFAETGIRDLFSLLHATIRQHGSKRQTVRLRNQWVNVDPRDWKQRNDLTIKVGLGSGNKQQQLAGIQLIVQSQIQGVQAGLVSKNNFWHSAQAMCRILGHQDAAEFFVDPNLPPDPQNPNAAPLPPPPDPKQGEIAAKAQAEQAKIQADAAHQKMKTEADIAFQKTKLEFDLAKEREKHALDMQLAREKHQMDMEQHRASMLEHMSKIAGTERKTDENGKPIGPDPFDNVKSLLSHMHGPTHELIAELKKANAPRRIVRDHQGKAVGSEPVSVQ
jgi:hypothetical protein